MLQHEREDLCGDGNTCQGEKWRGQKEQEGMRVW